MRRTLLKSKIHRATVTDANLEYEGSITIDERLMQAADMVEFEQVQIYNVSNGHRLTTYVIRGEPGSGTICLNGAAAHLASRDDLVIIASYASYSPEEVAVHRPRVILVDEHNQLRDSAAAQAAV